MSESLPVLAGVLRAAPESDALVILGRLLDSMPIPVLLTDCSDELHCLYGNEAWRAWVPADKFPVEDQSLLEVLDGLSASPLLASGGFVRARERCWYLSMMTICWM